MAGYATGSISSSSNPAQQIQQPNPTAQSVAAEAQAVSFCSLNHEAGSYVQRMPELSVHEGGVDDGEKMVRSRADVEEAERAYARWYADFLGLPKFIVHEGDGDNN